MIRRRFIQFAFQLRKIRLGVSDFLFGGSLAGTSELLLQFLHADPGRFQIGLTARNLLFKFRYRTLQCLERLALFGNVLVQERLAVFTFDFLGARIREFGNLFPVFREFGIAALAGIFHAARSKKFVHQRFYRAAFFFELALRLRCVRTPCRTCRFGTGDAVLERFEFRLAGGIYRFARLMRMILGTANRACDTVFKRFRHDSRLLVQEGAILGFVFVLDFLVLLIAFDIRRFRRFECLLQRSEFLHVQADLLQSRLPFRKLVQLRNQFLLLGARIAQRYKLFFQELNFGFAPGNSFAIGLQLRFELLDIIFLGNTPGTQQFQPVVFRKRILERRNAFLQAIALGLPFLGRNLCGKQRFECRLQLPDFRLGARKRCPHVFNILRPPEFFIQLGQLLFETVLFRLHLGKPIGIFAYDLFAKRTNALPVGNLTCQGQIFYLFQIRYQGRFRTAGKLRHRGTGIRFAIAALIFQFRGTPLEFVLQGAELIRLENLAENLLALIRRRDQQLHKVALRNHRNLRKLIAINANDSLHGRPNIFIFAHRTARRPLTAIRLGIVKRHRGRFFRESLAARLGAHVFGIAHNAVFPARIFERQVDFGLCFGGGIHATELFCVVAVLSARTTEQRIHNRIENRRLAGARIARNQIEPALAELIQIDDGPLRIRPEGRNNQSGRSHLSPSQIPSIMPCMNSLSSAFISRRFIS